MKKYLRKLIGITFILILAITFIGCNSLSKDDNEKPSLDLIDEATIEKQDPIEQVEEVLDAEEVEPIIETLKGVEVIEEDKKDIEEIAEAFEVKEEVSDTVEQIEEPVTEEVEKESAVVVEDKKDSIDLKEITNFPFGVKEIKKADGNDEFDLFIIHTGDINSNMQASSDGIGYSRLKTMIDEAKSITDNILLVDAGNVVKLDDSSYQYNGESAIKLLDDIGYDAIAISEGEFAFGLDNLLYASKMTNELNNLKLLSANALDNNDYLYFKPYQVYNYNGFKVAVVALTDFMNVDGVVFDSKVVMDNAQAAVQVARDYVDYVVVLGNFVANEAMSEKVVEYLGADLWIDGYAKNVPANGKMINDTLYVQSGKNFSQVGVVDVFVKDSDVVSESAFAITAADVDDPKNSTIASAYGIVAVPENAQIKSDLEKVITLIEDSSKVEDLKEEVIALDKEEPIIEEVVEAVEEEVIIEAENLEKTLEEVVKKVIIDESTIVVADIPSKLEGSLEAVGVKKTDLTYYLCKAMTRYSDADFTIINAGTFTSSIEAGNVTKGDIANALSNNDVLTVVELTGEQVYEIMEHGYSMLPQFSTQYSQTDLVAIYNRFADPGKRIIRLRTPGGDKIKDDEIYRVATTEYLADGGDGYVWFNNVLYKEGLLVDIFEDYLSTLHPIK